MLLPERKDFIHQIKTPKQMKEPIKPQPIDESKTTVFYGWDGLGREKKVQSDTSKALAKVVTLKDGSLNYFVKLGKVGRYQGKLVNPKDLSFTFGDEAVKIGNVPCYQWHLVNKALFDNYKNFLISGEEKWLRAAKNQLVG